MSQPPDLELERKALLLERAHLQKVCMDEWKIMSAQVAHQRQKRLWDIRDRLRAIESTKTWK